MVVQGNRRNIDVLEQFTLYIIVDNCDIGRPRGIEEKRSGCFTLQMLALQQQKLSWWTVFTAQYLVKILNREHRFFFWKARPERETESQSKNGKQRTIHRERCFHHHKDRMCKRFTISGTSIRPEFCTTTSSQLTANQK